MEARYPVRFLNSETVLKNNLFIFLFPYFTTAKEVDGD